VWGFLFFFATFCFWPCGGERREGGDVFLFKGYIKTKIRVSVMNTSSERQGIVHNTANELFCGCFEQFLNIYI